MEKPTIRVLEFKETFEWNDKTGKHDRPVDWVHYGPAHALQSTTIWARISDLKPRDDARRHDGNENQRELKRDAMRIRWDMIEPAYKAWKEGSEIPEYGTALRSWPGLNKAQIEAFVRNGIRTVEELRDLPEGLIGKVQLPGVRDLKKQAAAWLEAADKNVATNKVVELEASVTALSEQLAAAMQLLEEKTGPAKKPRGEARSEAA